MKDILANNISDEVLASFLDGNATATESCEIIDALVDDAELREIMQISCAVDAELGLQQSEFELLPMTAMAASCDAGSFCSLECEKAILQKFGIEFDEPQLLASAVRNGWQKEHGTALHNVGRHAESMGLVATRQYKATLNDIATALDTDKGVIVAVDGGELLGDRVEERNEDIFIGQIPDHTVVVLAVDAERNNITIFDPNSPNREDTYTLEQFENAWADSQNYLVIISQKDVAIYEPKPIDLSDVELTEDLNELREAIAENAHDVWALERKAQGWTYGPERNDTSKRTPCMVPYSMLPESEKTFDRDMAMNTLKLLRKLGYDIIKQEK